VRTIVALAVLLLASAAHAQNAIDVRVGVTFYGGVNMPEEQRPLSEPWKDVEVVVTGDNGTYVTAKTDSAGMCGFPDLPDGNYRVEAPALSEGRKDAAVTLGGKVTKAVVRLGKEVTDSRMP
jgi:hypothetical protein